jgi:hypothetical protein
VRSRLFLVASATTLTLGVAAPASAADETTGTILLSPGSLFITVPADAGRLGARVNTGAGTISGPLGQVKVVDARNAAPGAGWVASVKSTALEPTGAGAAIPASTVSYTAGPIDKNGTATYTANNPDGIATAKAAVTATAISGNNTATWNPTISVAVPADVASGVYTITIVHSVA